MAEWEPVIGLEIHVELQTKTKMFCGCALSFGDPPNTHTCPVCLAHPGALPVINQRAVEFATRIALALGCTVRPRNVFHRKNYFYPDSPKAYQISQFDEPLAVDGSFAYWVGDERRTCRINRVHMEEDAAKLVHAGESGRIGGSQYSVVDFNRGGTPLVEIVTEPDIGSPAAAREFLMQLRATVMELGVSDCNMEEGRVRWDANISVRPAGSSQLGVRTELKNMNSFRFLQQALESEIPRQIGILDADGTIDQETLHFDPDTGTTSPLRSKEEAHDYRYFPEPDLVPLVMDPAWVEEVRAAQPELPAARVERFMSQYGLSRYDAFLLGQSGPLGRFYEEVAAAGVDPKAAANWTMGEYLAYLKQAGLEPGQGWVTPERLAALVAMVTPAQPTVTGAGGLTAAPATISGTGTVSSSAAKDVFRLMIEERAEPAAVVEKHGLGQISDEAALRQKVAEIVAANPKEAAAYRAGKQQLMGFFVGQVMKSTAGRANPKLVNELMRAALDDE